MFKTVFSLIAANGTFTFHSSRLLQLQFFFPLRQVLYILRICYFCVEHTNFFVFLAAARTFGIKSAKLWDCTSDSVCKCCFFFGCVCMCGSNQSCRQLYFCTQMFVSSIVFRSFFFIIFLCVVCWLFLIAFNYLKWSEMRIGEGFEERGRGGEGELG